MKFLHAFFGWMQSQCKHEDRFVRADLLEGSAAHGKMPWMKLQWCERCGAYRFQIQTTHSTDWKTMAWRRPRAEWK